MNCIKKFKNFYVLDENPNNSFISGNKIRKMRGILENAGRIDGLLTFGSPFSSHLLACAWCAKKDQIPFIGIVLTDEEISISSYPNLKMAQNFDAQLIISKKCDAYETIELYRKKYCNYLWVPGGAHTLEAAIAYEIFFDSLFMNKKITPMIKNIIVPYGTGTTAYGIWRSVRKQNNNICVHGVSISRTKQKCLDAIKEFEESDCFNRLIIDDQFAGKYGNLETKTKNYRWKFFSETGILPDPIYNAKAIHFLYESGLNNVLIVNTGGMLNNLL
jgi:1-aminocyclopropane-1-carboxylate deaminase/D-cysteine desulfhydrase-like pyridoxal-dependent ACC family enzyme